MIASFTVGTTQTQILQKPTASPFKFVAFGNSGSVTAYLKLTPDSDAVTASNGLPLPAGSSLICDQDVQRELFDGGAFAITGGGTTNIAVQAF